MKAKKAQQKGQKKIKPKDKRTKQAMSTKDLTRVPKERTEKAKENQRNNREKEKSPKLKIVNLQNDMSQQAPSTTDKNKPTPK